jgi:hypothetical protein
MYNLFVVNSIKVACLYCQPPRGRPLLFENAMFDDSIYQWSRTVDLRAQKGLTSDNRIKEIKHQFPSVNQIPAGEHIHNGTYFPVGKILYKAMPTFRSNLNSHGFLSDTEDTEALWDELEAGILF